MYQASIKPKRGNPGIFYIIVIFLIGNYFPIICNVNTIAQVETFFLTASNWLEKFGKAESLADFFITCLHTCLVRV